LKLWQISPAQLLKSGTISPVKLRGFEETHAPASAKRNAPTSGQVLGGKIKLNPPSLAGCCAALRDVLQLESALNKLKHSP
jgi:hypothetical protein